MSFLDALPTIIQIIHDRDEMSRRKALRFSRRRYWPYRAIAAGNLVGDDYSAMIEREQDLRVVRQLAWNYEATTEQLDRLLELWLIGNPITDKYERDEVFYAIANHNNSSLKSRVILNRVGWKLNFSEHSNEELIAVIREFDPNNSEDLENLDHSDLVDILEAI
jgi:hypothetical protein